MCQNGDTEYPDTLIGFKKYMNANTCAAFPDLHTGYQSLTPLHLACAFNQVEIVHYLLSECGVRVNVTDSEGWTPLHSACMEGYFEIVELLVKCQGRGDATEKSNKEWFYVEDGPIDLAPLNYENETPVELALERDDMRIVNLLRGTIYIFSYLRNIDKVSISIKTIIS
jgi:ankyrin repeat protein